MIRVVLFGQPEKSEIISWLMNHLPHVEEMPESFHITVIRALALQDMEFLQEVKAARIRLEKARDN